MLVSALHIPGRERIHEICHSRFLGLVSSAIFDCFHTLDDIRGLCIAAFWQPDLSWKLSGLCIRMATELNLHHAFYEVFYMPDITDDARKESLEKTRLWYLLFVLDHQSSIAYGRPPIMAELRPIKDFEILLSSPWCTPEDRALMTQVTGSLILSKAFETFGLEPKRTMGGDDGSVLTHLRFTEDARAWKERWKHLKTTGNFTGKDYLSGGVDLHYCFSELVLNSLVLRGRPLDTLQDLPTSLRPLTLRAIEASHALLQHFIEEPGYRNGIVGMPLYLHSMIALAVVFLIKISHRWHTIGVTIDPIQRTRPLILGIIRLLRECKAGAGHMVFSMATGFERMLQQSSRQVTTEHVRRQPWNNETSPNGPLWADSQPEQVNGRTPAPSYIGEQQTFDPKSSLETSYSYPMQTASEISPYENWGFQDEQLWSLDMGYDLLAPSGESLAYSDFPLMLYDNSQERI